MCGIFGMIVPKGKQPDPYLVEKCTDRLIHRGPDDHGYFYKDQVALASRRLAILDLSFSGHQPMTYRNNTMVYNGEIYNYLELKRKLISKGYVFETGTDTEVVLAAYHFWGKACVDHFNGMWAFVIYDQAANALFCSRDRFGIKPFYYTMIGSDFCFASEIKAFRSNPDFKVQLNESIAHDFLTKGLQHHTNATFYKNVLQLEAGHHLMYNLEKSTYEIKQYYSLGSIDQNASLSFDEASKKFRNLLNDSVRLHMRADVKTGTALSGGLDSATVLGLQYLQLIKMGEPDLEAINYDPGVERYDEQNYIQDLLKKYPVKLRTTKKSFSELFKTLDQVIRVQDEPILSGSLLAQYEVFKLAKKRGIKVMLDGQGADELLAGYGTYYAPFFKYILAEKKRQLPAELFGFLQHHSIPFHKIKNRFDKSISYPSFLKLALEKTEKGKNFDNFQAYSIDMIQSRILPALLHFEDRNSMAHSVEARVPFLDYRLVNFCMSLPPEYKITKGVRKSLLRNSMKTVLPKSILQRYDKLGFVSPQEEWIEEYRDQFEKEICTIIKKNISIFDPSLIDFLVTVLNRKERKHYPFLWRILSFERWMNLVFQ